MMDKKIPIHWLYSQAYCEYQIYLEYVEGVEVDDPRKECRELKKIEKEIDAVKNKSKKIFRGVIN